ncbi:hypothetical protein [uncultured Desulfobulbus sp.]|uniref:hypothetical protein n=1 Tax=uncultured Desulfobulbus sp. TaxID=239745 RepID=UPI0029C83620|nr:hypothetical protein [uncultured Desulfobulbus sp.]
MISEKKIFMLGVFPLYLLGFFLFPCFLSGVAAELTGVKIVNPSHGYANIKGENISYYYYRAKIAADTEKSVLFKQDTCFVSDQKSKKYSKCWIHIAGASAGLSLSQQAPISMKTFGVGLEGSKSTDVVQWNTLLIDGPDGSIEFMIPKGGYVELNFLWEVPKGFSPSNIKIGDIAEVSL